MQGIAQDKECVFAVKGLKCQACCARLKRHILEHGGVKRCNVDFEKAEVTVQGQNLQKDLLAALIEQLGYEASLKSDVDIKESRQRQTGQCTDPQK